MSLRDHGGFGSGDCPPKQAQVIKPEDVIGAARSHGLKTAVALVSFAPPAVHPWIMASDGDCGFWSAAPTASLDRFQPKTLRGPNADSRRYRQKASPQLGGITHPILTGSFFSPPTIAYLKRRLGL